MKKKKNLLKMQLKYLKVSNLPAVISAKAHTFIVAGGIVAAISAILCIIGLIQGNNLKSLMLSPLCLGLISVIYGITQIISAAKRGFYELKGTCIRLLTPLGKNPGKLSAISSFQLEVEAASKVEFEDGQMVLTDTPELDLKLCVPVTSKRNVPDKDQLVTVYVPIDATTYDGTDGLTRANQIFGYKIG